MDCPQSTYASTFFATAIHVEPRGTAAVRSVAEEGNGHTGAATGKREAEICVHVVTAPPTRVRGLEIGIRLWLGDRSAWGSEIGVLV